MPDVTAIERKLAEAQRVFFSAADSVAAQQWNVKPAAESRSAAEVVAHLMMVERAVTIGAERTTLHRPQKIPVHKRIHSPLWLANHQEQKPIRLDPSLLGEKEMMLAGLRGAREGTFAFIDETTERDLNKYSRPHPFLGRLDVYECLEMIAAQQTRHAKQLKEIVDRLPKVGESSQK